MTEEEQMAKDQVLLGFEDFYTKENEIVYRYWRVAGQDWRKEATAYEEIPFVKMKV